MNCHDVNSPFAFVCRQLKQPHLLFCHGWRDWQGWDCIVYWCCLTARRMQGWIFCWRLFRFNFPKQLPNMGLRHLADWAMDLRLLSTHSCNVRLRGANQSPQCWDEQILVLAHISQRQHQVYVMFKTTWGRGRGWEWGGGLDADSAPPKVPRR